MQVLTTDVLVVGGGTGGTAAALQAARRGANVILVSEFSWLGGMLTSAGVTAPDGNELEAWQTGIWGAFLRELERRHPQGLDNGWVSFFTYDPRVGAEIFADWVSALPNLKWVMEQTPLEVLKQGDRVTAVRFADYTIHAAITLDGTELGDLLALGEIPYRWGWELQAEFGEPSAPAESNTLTETYPVQAPTWVMVMQDVGEGNEAAVIPEPPHYQPELFQGAWENYGGETFFNYGRLPGDRFMINWPIHGNDYGEGVNRLIGSELDQQRFLQEARWHSQGFAHFIQTLLGRRYGLAEEMFPLQSNTQHSTLNTQNLLSGYALHPYYRESRRLRGLTTIREQDLLPIAKGQVAALPVVVKAQGYDHAETICDAIAIANYANDHHYPSGDIKLAPKSIRWGGRWTGTPFTIPYRALIPETVEGFLACEKNISVSHMANGATRLQPCVLGIGQAAGMAAALCIEQNCQPRELQVRSLQEALLTDAIAPTAIIPLFNQPIDDPEWLEWQRFYLNQPDAYPGSGYAPTTHPESNHRTVGYGVTTPPVLGVTTPPVLEVSGTFKRLSNQHYELLITAPIGFVKRSVSLVTLNAGINHLFECLDAEQRVAVVGRMNPAGNWFLVHHCHSFQNQ